MIVAVVLIVVLLLYLPDSFFNKVGSGKYGAITGRNVLTLNEQPTFVRLKETLPQYHVLAQVAFSAFLTSKDYRTRNRFNRKRADFVVLDPNFNVISIVELDDARHRSPRRIKADLLRDVMITEAGFKVLRYKRTPSQEEIMRDLFHQGGLDF